MSSLHGVQIYIYEDSYWNGEPVVAKLQVLDDDETTLHYGGSSSRERTINFWLLDHTNYDTLAADKKAGTTVTLVDWLTNSYNVKILELSINDALWDIGRPATNYTVLRCKATVIEQ